MEGWNLRKRPEGAVMASTEERESSTGSGSPTLASDGNDSFNSGASSDDRKGSPVTCIIRSSLAGRGKECCGSTLEELKAAAKRHVDKGYNIMYLIQVLLSAVSTSTGLPSCTTN
ncbi:hypothetical protein RvY_08261 [Ramazzottius varieornatus]|uniref:Uncharacterized protein n=1 Tax=Ramazzottius varieornatus TaxID=947166 RepID=A0A1D1V575_RAMVA|nr:hypothetical protein RvY_08261 [Ramazzottius varieornatus]